MARQEITAAIRSLGERSRNVEISYRSERAIVYVNKEYFGVYDLERHTFID